MTQSDFCDYSRTYNVVEGPIIVRGANDDAYDNKIVFENKAPFISCITKILRYCNAHVL